MNSAWFQQDGARPYTSNAVLSFLNYVFETVLSNRYSALFEEGFSWPPNSPDLNPCDLTIQPTQMLTEGGVLRKRHTSSLARFDRSCVINALLDMVNGALKLNRGCAYANEIFVLAEGLDFFKRGVIPTGGRLSHEATCPL
jgi:hypothetical protein